MNVMKRKMIDLGFMDVPVDYNEYSKEEKELICDRFIDILINYIDKELMRAPHINRVDFLNEILKSSLVSNEHLENYEVCSVIRDMQLRLNED